MSRRLPESDLPPQNRDPLEIEQDACFPWLQQQMDIIRPKIIVCLGRIAAMRLISEDFRITRQHGMWTEKDGVWYTSFFHPSALLRDPQYRPASFRDLKSLQAKASELCSRTTFER